MLAKIMHERSALAAKFMPKGEDVTIFSRAMGLSSFRLAETMTAYSDMRRKCKMSALGYHVCVLWEKNSRSVWVRSSRFEPRGSGSLLRFLTCPLAPIRRRPPLASLQTLRRVSWTLSHSCVPKTRGKARRGSSLRCCW